MHVEYTFCNEIKIQRIFTNPVNSKLSIVDDVLAAGLSYLCFTNLAKHLCMYTYIYMYVCVYIYMPVCVISPCVYTALPGLLYQPGVELWPERKHLPKKIGSGTGNEYLHFDNDAGHVGVIRLQRIHIAIHSSRGCIFRQSILACHTEFR